MFNDYYKILDIPFNATAEEIKRAYRIKAKLYHPDVNTSLDANQFFALINEAYEVLADDDKRFRFDLKYKHRNRQDFQPSSEHSTVNTKKRRQDFHYDWSSYNQPRHVAKDMRETHPVLFHILFLFGMFVGFLLTILSIVGTYLRLWPFVFIVIIIPGLVLVVEGFNGINEEFEGEEYILTNRGELYRVMSTIVKVIKLFMVQHSKVVTFEFTGIAKEDEGENRMTQRVNLYRRYLPKIFNVKQWNFDYSRGNTIVVNKI